MLADFETLLKRAIGLDAASIGSSAVERAVLSRQKACKANDLRAYWEYLSVDKGELQELIEAVVVPETWFFRCQAAFAALVQIVRKDGLADRRDRPLRVLSIPCASGEEPYSIAMALSDAGIPPAQFRLVGIDISRIALARARHAAYGKNSFRGNDLSFRDRHFDEGPDGYRLNPQIRQCVQFQHGNLFDVGLQAALGIFDIVFCRNLLIYFDCPAQASAAAILAQLLAPGGSLFVGPSESSALHEHGFESAGFAHAIALRKRSPAEARLKAAGKPSASARPLFRSPLRKAPESRYPPPALPVADTSPPKLSVADIRRLADKGHLAEAASSCERYLRDHGPQAEPLYLLGVIRDASGNHVGAAELYRKALYIHPRHKEALAHLAALLEAQGDAEGARVIQERLRRLERAQQEGEPGSASPKHEGEPKLSRLAADTKRAG